MVQPTTVFGNKTLEAMRNLVYAGIRRKASDPLAGLSATFVDGYIAKWDAYFVDYARWNFDTFKRQRIVAFKSGTTLADDLDLGDTSALLTSNDNASASGRISINGDLIDYTGVDTPTAGQSITLATAAGTQTPDIDHVTGERVEFLIAAPSDFGKPGEMWYMHAGAKASDKILHRDWRDMPIPIGRFYTYHDGYLILPQNLNAQNFQLHYWKKAMKPVAGDSLQTPERHDDFVRYCAMAECYIIMKDFDEANKMFALAGAPTPNNPEPIGILQHAVAHDAEQTNSVDEVFIPDLGTFHM